MINGSRKLVVYYNKRERAIKIKYAPEEVKI
jgi:hypothetical protein